jgi:hypothetical protein
MSLAPNQGATALAAVDTITATAAKLGCSTRQVSRWRSSQQLPDERSRETIERCYGIARGLWDRPVMAPSGGPADAPAAPEPHTPPSDAEAPPETAEARLRAQLERLRLQRQGATGRALVELEKLELQASRALARAEGVELDGRKIAKSRAWQTVEEVIIKALEPFPDAMVAVARATQEHGNGAP